VGKVLGREALVAACEDERARGRTIVFTNGCFDILHAGHAHYLEQAKAQGDVLIVGVNTDESVRALKGPTRPVVPQDDRAYLLSALASVDYVCLFGEPTPSELIAAVRPDVLVKGAGYTRDNIVGADLVEALGGRVVALPELPGRSTRSIIARVVESAERGDS